jgi:hypothetical protein
MPKFKDISGEPFGPLIAQYPKPVGQSKGAREWLCRCMHCGRSEYVSQAVLRGKLRKFCFHHGESGTPLYQAWTAMNHRHGKKVCRGWQQCYVSFKVWALANGYKPGAVLIRFYDDGLWDQKNCMWTMNGAAISAPATRQRHPKP